VVEESCHSTALGPYKFVYVNNYSTSNMKLELFREGNCFGPIRWLINRENSNDNNHDYLSDGSAI